MAILQASSAPNLHKPPIGLPGLVAVAVAMFCAPVAPDVGLLFWLTPTKLSTWSSTCRRSLALRMLTPSCNCAPAAPCGPRNASIVPLPSSIMCKLTKRHSRSINPKQDSPSCSVARGNFNSDPGGEPTTLNPQPTFPKQADPICWIV